MHPVSVLRFCCTELAEREIVDRPQRWLWRIRRKVSVYCLRKLERDEAALLPREPLTDAEASSVKLSHPLLRPWRGSLPVTPPPEPLRGNLHRRVQAYIDSLKARAQNSLRGERPA